MLVLTMFAAAASVGTFVADGESVTLTLLSEKAMSKIGYYSPMRAKLGPEKPASITKVPDDLASPQFGIFEIAGASGAKYHLILDEPEGKPARLFIDANGNGDLTDDDAPEWKAKESGEGDAKHTMYSGVGHLNLGTGEQRYVVTIGLYRFDKNDPQRAALKDVLLYYRDYALQGTMTLGGKSYNVLISDEQTTGDFRGKEPPPAPALLSPNASDAEKKAAEEEAAAREKASSGISLLIDVNDNGKFEKRGERFDLRKPFNIAGTTYEITDVAQNGLSMKVVKSDKTVAEIPLAPDHSVGKKITSFEAQTTDGKTVDFPGDYKGKIVMIDFWATWCGPCMKEVPGLVEVYKKLHDQGFEVLGISLDSDKTIAKLKPVTAEKGMTWTQVADGKYWDAAIAQMYVVNSIPACWLVDGDTGEILATESDLRGAALQGTIEKFLAKKKGT